MSYKNYPCPSSKSQVLVLLSKTKESIKARFTSPENGGLRISKVVFVAIFLFMFAFNVYADDPCKDIGDLDDRAACYGKEKEEKEEEYQSLSSKLDDLRDQKDNIAGQIEDLSGQLNIKQSEIDALQASIVQLQNELEVIEDNLTNRRGSLKEKTELRNKVVRTYYQKGVLNELEMFLTPPKDNSLNGFQYSTLSYMFEKSLSSEALRLIGILNAEITNFELDKAAAQEIKIELETAQADLISIKAQLDNEKVLAQKEFGSLETKEEDYETELVSLEEEIANLSAKQQEVLNKKSGSGNGTVGDYESVGWSIPDPSFKPAFGVFSYGAYTHYRGLSQYGAKGRAEDGKSYKDIIKFYYKNEVKEKDDFPDKIKVDGYGELDFQYYLYGIAEMPSDWPEDALKAQAVAARTYAYRYYKAGKSICTSQSCQVFLESKAKNPPEKWRKAVDDTKNKIISGDSHAMYSSTTGGYIDDGVGWDVDGSWPKDAYEKKADSPWFRWAWWTEGTRFDGSNCGRDYPWLTEKEMADILNSWVVWRKGSDSDKKHVSPVTTSCWGGDPYSIDKMAEKAADIDKKFSKINSVDTEIGNNGRTQIVRFETDQGTVTISGEEFKTVFNLRAPSYVAIKSRLYDLEREN